MATSAVRYIIVVCICERTVAGRLITLSRATRVIVADSYLLSSPTRMQLSVTQTAMAMIAYDADKKSDRLSNWTICTRGVFLHQQASAMTLAALGQPVARAIMKKDFAALRAPITAML